MSSSETAQYYESDLAYIHCDGYGFHADACAPGILRLLEPVRASAGTVLELGCGGGALTRHLVDAGHAVVATDASAAMVDIARRAVPEADVRQLTLPDDPLPEADAIVSVGHVLGYLPDEEAVFATLRAAAHALRSGGVFAVDMQDLEYGRARVGEPAHVARGSDWLLVTEFDAPAPRRFTRDITFFREDPATGLWRRGHEFHPNVLLDLERDVIPLLEAEGVEATARSGFGEAVFGPGLYAVEGRRVR